MTPTSRIAVGRVLAGGFVAGLVILVLNIPAQLVLGERVQTEANAWLPGAAAQLQPSAAGVAAGLVMKLVIGIVLVWLYAAVRPRFGPGLSTASFVAVAAWLLGAIFFSDFALVGMMSWGTYATLELLQLVAFVVATWAGAWLYRER